MSSDLPSHDLQKRKDLQQRKDLQKRKRRARYRAWHRGILEMDEILGSYADAHLESAGATELERFERLMEEMDTDLLAWISSQRQMPAHIDADLVARIRTFQLKRAGI